MKNLGYQLLARAEMLGGSTPAWVQRMCALADLEAAPRDVVLRGVDGRWVRDRQITDPVRRMGLGLSPLPAAAEPEGEEDWRGVRVRWTEIFEAVIDVPADIATSRPGLLEYLLGDWSWTQDADPRVLDAYLSEVEPTRP
jgi:hypothetical protein